MKELTAEELKEWKRIITDVLREFQVYRSSTTII